MVAGKSLNYFYKISIATLGLCVFSDRIYPQPLTPPQLNAPAFNPNSLQTMYSSAGHLQDEAAWSNYVLNNVQYYKTNWENTVDQAILSYVSSVTTSDGFTTVQEYQDYLYKALQSQEQTSLNTWVAAADVQIYAERDAFLQSLLGANYQVTAQDQANFQNQLNQTLNSKTNTPTQSSQVMGYVQSEWQKTYDTNLQDGISQYTKSLQDMQNNYQALVNQLNQTDAQFQANLQQINSYKQLVIKGIQTEVNSVQSYLNSEDLFWNHDPTDPTKKTTLTADGQTLQTFLNQIQTDINQNLPLSTIAGDLSSFLKSEQQMATNNVTYYTNLEYSTTPIRYNGGGPLLLVNDYNAGNPGGYNLTSVAYEIKAYNDGAISQAQFMNWLNIAKANGLALMGLTGDLQVSSIVAADNYAIWSYFFPGSNVEHYCFDAWGIKAGCNIGDVGDPVYAHVGSGFTTYADDTVDSNGNPVTNYYQADQISVILYYNTYDPNAAISANNWNSLKTQLTGFSANFTNTILPAISNWEIQTSQYQSQYAAFQAQKTQELATAQANYQSGVAKLQSEQAAWMMQMEDLQKQAVSQFAQASITLSKSEANGDGTGFNSSLANLFNTIPVVAPNTNASNVAQNFSAQIASLVSQTTASAQTNLPDTSNLQNIYNNINQGLTATQNFSLLSAVNNSLLNARSGFIQNFADSLSKQMTFTDKGEGELLQAYGDSTVTGKNGIVYITDSNGNIRTDAKGNNLTLQSFIASTCGADLSNAACSSYTTHEYTDVTVQSNGSVLVTRNVHTGNATYSGKGDATDANNYNYDTKAETFTIQAPGMIAFGATSKNVSPPAANNSDQTVTDGHTGVPRQNSLLAASLNGSGTLQPAVNLFDSNAVNQFANTALTNLNRFENQDNLNKLVNGMMEGMAAVDKKDSEELTAAQQNAQSRASTVSLMEDFAKNVLLGGMSTSGWVKSQLQSMVNQAESQVLASMTGLSPDVASQLLQWYKGKQAAKKAKSQALQKEFVMGATIIGGIVATLFTGPVGAAATEGALTAEAAGTAAEIGAETLAEGAATSGAEAASSSMFETAGNAISNFTRNAMSSIGNFANSTMTTVSNLADSSLSDLASSAYNSASEFVSDVGSSIANGARGIANSARALVSDSATTTASDGAQTAAGTVESGANASTQILSKSQVALTKAILQGAQGYENGGLKGAVTGAISGMGSAYMNPYGLNVNVSYSDEGGFGGGVSVGPSTLNVGANFSQHGTTSFNIGTKAGNLKYDPASGFSGSINMTGGNPNGVMVNVGQHQGPSLTYQRTEEETQLGGSVTISENGDTTISVTDYNATAVSVTGNLNDPSRFGNVTFNNNFYADVNQNQAMAGGDQYIPETRQNERTSGTSNEASPYDPSSWPVTPDQQNATNVLGAGYEATRTKEEEHVLSESTATRDGLGVDPNSLLLAGAAVAGAVRGRRRSEGAATSEDNSRTGPEGSTPLDSFIIGALDGATFAEPQNVGNSESLPIVLTGGNDKGKPIANDYSNGKIDEYLRNNPGAKVKELGQVITSQESGKPIDGSLNKMAPQPIGENELLHIPGTEFYVKGQGLEGIKWYADKNGHIIITTEGSKRSGEIILRDGGSLIIPKGKKVDSNQIPTEWTKPNSKINLDPIIRLPNDNNKNKPGKMQPPSGVDKPR
ncbi:large structural domain protein [Leptospira inadai serovar Lyme str. 10]|uniref:Large structural domain protein n=1 Tax=Leptospira inadai serovar Lyme str. 10 TaxID=1049790 RepID=V6HBX4_9LEPT|nr:TIGR04388 family protein [Leptospira inadai]EQA37251.1 large structural domain protein [Leptospira inadai serovar Lyme str. 10]